MLDDTYAIRGDLREFLNTVRGDQFATSYSVLVQSDDLEYYSNRITKSAAGLRYKYTIHEVIQEEGNITVVVPKAAAYVYDHRAPYMEKRTMDRKSYDLQCLHDMMREDPANPRHMYYLAQTYNILGDYEAAAKWFEARATSKLRGFDQEVVDSWFELARLYNFKLGRPWHICEAAYMKAHEADPSRPDALYFMGIHWHTAGNGELAFQYFKAAFQLGYPLHAQFSLKPTLANYYLPKFLAPLAYEFAEPALGLAACQRFASFIGQNPKCEEPDAIQTMASWGAIFQLLVSMPVGTPPTATIKPQIVFCVDGGWGPWTGRDILTKGVGGSETWAIELARAIQAGGTFDCTVFCRCQGPDIFEGIAYRPITEFPSYIASNTIHTCIVSRYSEYLPLTFVHGVRIENVYFVLHDVCPTGNVIPLHPKLRRVICLTDWHAGIFKAAFPQLADRTDSFYYGISPQPPPTEKVPNSFIYSSFPNRGLLQLLRMWPSIIAALPDATLHIYADVSGEWVNRVSRDEMTEVKTLLGSGLKGVTLHGWVSKAELAAAWGRADIWLYPATFKETFCLTALEAAASGTLAICPPLAALAETAAAGGILVPGDAGDASWHAACLASLLAIQADPTRKASLIAKGKAWASTLSWSARAEEFQAKYLRRAPVIADMYNWSHDIPTGSRVTFEAALATAAPRRILEIGTYAGTSLIEMLRLCPSATAITIDRWTNYEENGLAILSQMKERNIEHIFYANIRAAGMTDRVSVMKGDSVDMLLRLVEQGCRFDFIYIDGSHKCIDCYADMAIAWRLLHPGGVLAVDDMYYMSSLVESGEAVLAYPLRGIEHFLEREAGSYVVIGKDYRIFLQKLPAAAGHL
jgi:glycosyltransferase involved in cell wall biosynthesis/precorrin-6B methylase 2